MTRKFFVQVRSGEKFMIDELDYNNIQHRIATGRSNGWYKQRGENVDKDRFDWSLNFTDISGTWADKEKRVDKIVKPVDLEKRKPPKADEPEVPATKDCHNWEDDQTWDYVTTFNNGAQRYHKQCKTCNAKSILVKKREVELNMEKRGLSLDDVALVE